MAAGPREVRGHPLPSPGACSPEPGDSGSSTGSHGAAGTSGRAGAVSAVLSPVLSLSPARAGPAAQRWHRSPTAMGSGLTELLPKLGGSSPFSPPWIIALMQNHRTKTPRLAVIITCKHFQTIRSGRGSVCSLGQSYTGFGLFTTRLNHDSSPKPSPAPAARFMAGVKVTQAGGQSRCSNRPAPGWGTSGTHGRWQQDPAGPQTHHACTGFNPFLFISRVKAPTTTNEPTAESIPLQKKNRVSSTSLLRFLQSKAPLVPARRPE